MQITIGAAAVGVVHLAARPGSLPPTGGRTALVATVFDGAQNPLPGIRVAFAASAGVLRERAVTTDLSGEARTVLAKTTPAEVTASVGEISASASVLIEPPTSISIDVAPARPTVGQAVSFEVTLSNESRASPWRCRRPATRRRVGRRIHLHDHRRCRDVRDVSVDFGDGSSTSLGALSGQGSVVHAYERDGDYTVRATVVDVAGRRHVTSIAVRVRPAPGIQVAVTASPAAPVRNQPVTFTVDVSPAAGAPAVRDVTIDFGDRSSTALGALSGRGSVAHTYRNVGSYIVTATVLDAADRRHASSIGIVVAEDSEG